MAWIPEPGQLQAAREYIQAEAAWLRAETYRARTTLQRQRMKATLEMVAAAQAVAHDLGESLNEARIYLYLMCAYDPQQVKAVLVAAYGEQ